jgi:hypothetical protein
MGFAQVRTDYLFAQPSFLSGAARVLDVFGVFDFYNFSPTPEQAEARAMYVDWAMVGQDLQKAMAEWDAACPADAERQGELFRKRRP